LGIGEFGNQSLNCIIPQSLNVVMNQTADKHNVVGAVMVVGGGIAGIQGAMDLADAGFYVYLVESSPAIGGVMAGLDKTFPTNDCSI
jgi:heterodisulfide reductase subunit A